MAADALIHESRIAVPYKWSAGLTGSRFLKAVAEQRVFLASRCPRCRRVSVPPLGACGRCFVACEQGVPVGPRGAVTSFTEAAPAGMPGERKLFALIRLDGADTSVLHRIEERELGHPRIGLWVEPVFAQGPQDAPLGVLYFRPSLETEARRVP